MYYDYPMRKRFEIEIPGYKLNILGKEFEIGKQILKYEQANIVDTLEFLQDKDQAMRIIKFIQNRIKINRQVAKGLRKLGDTILNTYFYGVFNNKKKGKKIDRQSIFSADLVAIAEKLSIDPNTLLNNYTMEQLDWFIEGIVFYINEQSEEGKIKNDMRLSPKSDKTEYEIKQLLDKIPG